MITLDLSPTSSLQWPTLPQKETFSFYIHFGSWEDIPLAIQGLQHIVDTLWIPLQKKIKTFSLYQGPYSQKILETLEQITTPLPRNMPLSLTLDVQCLSRTEQALLLTKERLRRYHKIDLKGLKLPRSSLSISKRKLDGNIGILLPDFGCRELLSASLDLFINEKIAFHIIPEALLTEMWAGLDILYFFPEGLSPEGKRGLEGFQAALGNVEALTICNFSQKIRKNVAHGNVCNI